MHADRRSAAALGAAGLIATFYAFAATALQREDPDLHPIDVLVPQPWLWFVVLLFLLATHLAVFYLGRTERPDPQTRPAVSARASKAKAKAVAAGPAAPKPAGSPPRRPFIPGVDRYGPAEVHSLIRGDVKYVKWTSNNVEIGELRPADNRGGWRAVMADGEDIGWFGDIADAVAAMVARAP